MGFLSDRSSYAKNDIEVEDVVSERLRSQGRKIVAINRGDPTFYIKTADYVIDAYVRALKERKTHYSKAQGINEFLDAISRRYKRMHNLHFDRDDIVVTEGVSEALYMMNSALVNEGDNAVLFKPYYPPYMSNFGLAGGTPVVERYDEADSWNVHIEELKRSLANLRRTGKIKHTKYMLVTNPNNPTGTVLRKKILEEIASLANEYGIFLISDEIYDEIVYNGAKFTSMSELAKGIPHAILNGVSKSYNATGFRVGYAIVPEDDARSMALKRKLAEYCMVRVSSNTPAQYACAEAMNNVKAHNQDIKRLVKTISERMNFAVKMLEENPYLEIVRPNGAYYIFPKIHLNELKFKTDMQFVDTLLKKEGVQIVWGSAFGAPSHIRVVGLAPKEILEYAVNRINDFCRKNAKK